VEEILLFNDFFPIVKGMYRQSEKNLLNSNISSTCPHNMLNFHPLTAEIRDQLASLGHPSKFQWVLHLGFVIFAI